MDQLDLVFSCSQIAACPSRLPGLGRAVFIDRRYPGVAAIDVHIQSSPVGVAGVDQDELRTIEGEFCSGTDCCRVMVAASVIIASRRKQITITVGPVWDCIIPGAYTRR